MGASSSTQQHPPSEQREVESLAASTGALSLLRNAFSKLAHPQTNTLPPQSLQVHYMLNFTSFYFLTSLLHLYVLLEKFFPFIS